MQYKVSIGSRYTVTADATDCVVTDAAGRVVATVKPGAQYTFTASTNTVELSDAAAALTATFNSAPAAGGAGGVSEDDLVTLGVLTAGEAPVEKSSLPVNVLSGDFSHVTANGFSFQCRTEPPAGCNGVAIVVGDDVEDDFLLGCKMLLGGLTRGLVTLISDPLVSVQDVGTGRRCLFCFPDTIPIADTYVIGITKNDAQERVPFLSGKTGAGYITFNWQNAVSDASGYYPALAWEVLKKEPVYSPAVDSVPTEDSARPVSSGGVFAALAQLSGGSGASPDDCEWALCYMKNIVTGTSGQPDFSDYAATIKSISDSAVSYGGAVLPLGPYCILLRAPYAGAWNDNDFGLFVVDALKQWNDLGQEACFVYFNM